MKKPKDIWKPLQEHHQRNYDLDKAFLEDRLSCCESPIEKMLGIALHSINIPEPDMIPVGSMRITGPGFTLTNVEESFEVPPHYRHRNDSDKRLVQYCAGAALFPQFKVEPYRADFLLAYRNYRTCINIIIECDGHDFHERTKEQAARDKRRDRVLTAQGFKVFRFTGAEIYKDSEACAKEVEEFLEVEAVKRFCDVEGFDDILTDYVVGRK